MGIAKIETEAEFANDVLKGLKAKQKFLNSKYFYDEEGSGIFQHIMAMDEYYLTGCELEIFESYKHEIYKYFSSNVDEFELIELGAGDGLKTKILLKHFIKMKCDFNYDPIDISEAAVVELSESIRNEMPELKINPLIGDYFEMIDSLGEKGDVRKVLLFLGSNIGNFDNESSISFLNALAKVMLPNDFLFIGFDLKKEPQLIIDAYNDPHGYTAAFNLNLLKRINRELNGSFNMDCFEHNETYDSESGVAKSSLVSTIQQDVTILDQDISFAKGESIFMEISQKYDFEMINKLADKAGFIVEHNFTDSRNYFTNSLWKLK